MKEQLLKVGAVVTTLFVATAVVPGPTRAQAIRDNGPVLYGSVSPQVESTLERTAAVVLRHLSEARYDIYRKALPHAQREMSEAVRLLNTIRNDLSTATAKNLILIARNHLKYDTADRVLSDLPPIYDALDRISVYLPTDKARLHLDRARIYLAGRNKQGAEQELVHAAASLRVVEVDLPLLRSQRYVTAAERYLAARNPARADELLKLAEYAALALYRAEHIPLYGAKQDLWLAFRNYSALHNDTFRRFLAQARENLGKASAGLSPSGQEQIAALSRELSALAQKQATHEPIAEAALKGLWERSEALAERSVAYMSAGLSEAETTLAGENDIIEARLHAAYAESYQLTTHEPDKAAAELTKASGYVEHAIGSRSVSPADRKKLRAIGAFLAYLTAHPGSGDAAVQDRYDAVIEGLDGLIQTL